MGKKIAIVLGSVIFIYISVLAFLSYRASNDLLNAFVELEQGVSETVDKFEANNERAYSLISNSNENKLKADSIRVKSDRVVNYLKLIKEQLVVQSNNNFDHQTIGFDLLVEQEMGVVLKSLIVDYRNCIIEIVDDEEIVDRVKVVLSTNTTMHNNIEVEFSQSLCEHLPMMSVLANLTLYQSYIRNTEADVVSFLVLQLNSELEIPTK